MSEGVGTLLIMYVIIKDPFIILFVAVLLQEFSVKLATRGFYTKHFHLTCIAPKQKLGFQHSRFSFTIFIFLVGINITRPSCYLLTTGLIRADNQ